MLFFLASSLNLNLNLRNKGFNESDSDSDSGGSQTQATPPHKLHQQDDKVAFPPSAPRLQQRKR